MTDPSTAREALLAEVSRRDWAHSRRRMRDLGRLRESNRPPST